MEKDPNLKNLVQKEIKINKDILKISDMVKKKFFKEKILGVHFRGTSYKQSAGHPFPATKQQMLNLVKKIMHEEKIEKIFLSTEETDYLKFFLKEFKDKVIYLKSSYRSNLSSAEEYDSISITLIRPTC